METIIAGIFGLLIGAAGIWTGFRQLGNRKALNHWSITKGKVIERGIYQPNIPTLSAGAFRYSPLVKYSYRVDGKEYINDTIHPKKIQLPEHNSKKWAQKKVDSFPDEVTVYYNPQDPAESYLLQTSKATLYIVIGVSFLIILWGVIILLTTSVK